MSIQKVPNLNAVTTEDVRAFWQANPLCVAGNPYEPGTTEFFDFYNTQREAIESIPYSYALHEYCDFRGKKVTDIILRGARFLPNRLFQPLASLLGWNLYAKARKPS